MTQHVRSTGCRLAVVMTAALLLAGCGSNRSEPQAKPAELAARFEPRILDDGTKLFTYSVQLPRPGSSQLTRSRRPAEAPVDHWVSHLLLENGFCQQGFVTLDHYQVRGRAVLRGECREAATAQDRERF